MPRPRDSDRGRARGFAAVVAAVAVAAACAGCASYLDGAENRTPGEFTDDVAIHAILKARLLGDAEVRSLRINLEVDKGVVFLRGYVGSEPERDRAQTVAAGVRGVRRVENRLQIML